MVVKTLLITEDRKMPSLIRVRVAEGTEEMLTQREHWTLCCAPNHCIWAEGAEVFLMVDFSCRESENRLRLSPVHREQVCGWVQSAARSSEAEETLPGAPQDALCWRVIPAIQVASSVSCPFETTNTRSNHGAKNFFLLFSKWENWFIRTCKLKWF